MREVAAASGVTTPVLYDHFADKDALYRAVIEEHAAELNLAWGLRLARCRRRGWCGTRCR